MSFLESFVRAYFKPVEPSLTRNPAGGWVVRVPVPIYAEVTLSEREVVSGRLSPRGFLRELTERTRVAVEQVMRDQETR